MPEPLIRVRLLFWQASRHKSELQDWTCSCSSWLRQDPKHPDEGWNARFPCQNRDFPADHRHNAWNYPAACQALPDPEGGLDRQRCFWPSRDQVRHILNNAFANLLVPDSANDSFPHMLQRDQSFLENDPSVSNIRLSGRQSGNTHKLPRIQVPCLQSSHGQPAADSSNRRRNIRRTCRQHCACEADLSASAPNRWPLPPDAFFLSAWRRQLLAAGNMIPDQASLLQLRFRQRPSLKRRVRWSSSYANPFRPAYQGTVLRFFD